MIVRGFFIAAAALASAMLAAPAAAAGTDCPLAHQPYSSRTPLGDLLLDPRAKAVIEREAPMVLKPFGGSELPPGFANIVTPETGLKFVKGDMSKTAVLDRELGKIALTPQAVRARCARYDQVAPMLPKTLRRPAILVFDKITGFRDAPSVEAAGAALQAMAQRRGWSIFTTSNGAVFNPRDLKRFDVVVWNNVSGDALTVPQQNAFKRWLAAGGGFAGMHGSGGDPFYVWDWYADTLIGARFIGHPGNPQFQAARVNVSDPNSAITRGLGDGWTMTEEWYSFAASPRLKGAHILATLEESSYSPIGYAGESLRMGEHPIAWTQCIGDGRSFYTAIGHRPENYREPNSLRLLEQGIAWAAGQGETRCVAGREAARAR